MRVSHILDGPPIYFSRSKLNLPKNRYTDVLCIDQSRVKLSVVNDDTDYINANFLDGYKQKNAYISTQGEPFFGKEVQGYILWAYGQICVFFVKFHEPFLKLLSRFDCHICEYAMELISCYSRNYFKTKRKSNGKFTLPLQNCFYLHGFSRLFKASGFSQNEKKYQVFHWNNAIITYFSFS